MIINLQRLPNTLQGPAGDGYHGHVPERARLLAPDAADSLMKFDAETGHKLVATDIFRSAAASLEAYKAYVSGKKVAGVQRPGYSGHGYGLSVDFDVVPTLKNMHINYAQFSDLLAERGWWCHRRDLDPTASESWHFNYLGANSKKYLTTVDPQNHATWANAVEAAIQDRYGTQMLLTASQIQEMLLKLAYYKGPISGGLANAATQLAVKSFQHAWFLQEDGVPGKMTQRTLAYVAATINIIDGTPVA